MTASTYHSLYYKPSYGRLNSNKGVGWCTRTADRNDEWLQVDLGQLVQVCGVATQGDSQFGDDEWVTAFKLFYSEDGATWTTYTDDNGNVVVRFNVIWSKGTITLFYTS